MKQVFLTGAAIMAAIDPQGVAAEHHLHDDKCRILSFRGGGVHGAFEAGVIMALTDLMPTTELFYDYVAGVSIGAVNASVFATFPLGEEKEAARYVASMFDGASSDGLFEMYSPLIIKAFTMSSLSDNSNFKNQVAAKLEGRPWQRKVSIIAGDIITGQAVFFDESVPMEERVEAVVSSTSIPFVFPPRPIDDMYLVDGGIFANISLGDPIERCRQDGYTDENIIVDAILCYGDVPSIEKWSFDEKDGMRWKNASSFYQRRKAITELINTTEDFTRLKRGYHNVNFRFAIKPTKTLTSGFVAVNASTEDVRKEMWQGYHDASNYVHEYLQDGLTADDHPNPYEKNKA